MEERNEIVKEILEQGELHYDEETKEIAAIMPRPALLPVLRLFERIIPLINNFLLHRWQQMGVQPQRDGNVTVSQ